MKIFKGPAGEMEKEIKLQGDRKLVFGSKEENDSPIVLIGEKINDKHFEIDYEGTGLILRNLNLDCWESCGLYRRVFADEEYCLRPGNAFRIGTLEFTVERYNTGIVSDIGQRQSNEDSY